MEFLNATIIQIEVESNKYIQKPYPKFLHGLCYYLAGNEYPHKKYNPPMFHPYITKWKANKWGTHGSIRISSISQNLTTNIFHSLKKIETLRLGSAELEIKNFTIEKQEIIPLDTHSAIPVPNEFKINFITPTKFRTREVEHYETKAYPDIKLFIRSAARNLHILFNVKISLDEQDEIIRNIHLINAIGYPVQAKIGKNSSYEDSFIGELQLSCRNLDIGQKKILGLLLKISKYMGVGHKRGYGYGHIQIQRPDNNCIS